MTINSKALRVVRGGAWPALFVAAFAFIAACGSDSSPEPAVDQTREPLVSTVPPLVLAPLALVGFEFVDRTTNTTTDIARVNGHLTWPSPYDITPSRVHFLWAPQGDFPAADIPKLSARNGYALDVYLNGTKLVDTQSGAVPGNFYTTVFPGGPGCPVGVSCLGVSVTGDALPGFGDTWTLKLVVTKTVYRGSSSQTVVGYVAANPNPTSYFLAKIAPTFQSQRCMHCHQLGSKDLIIAHHVNNGIGGLTPSYIIETEVPPNGTQLRCADTSGCHAGLTAYSVPGKTFLQNEWMTPKFDQFIDWTGKTPYLICQKIKSRLTTPEKMKTHFFEDARIGWAVSSGEIPTNKPALSKAPPGDYYAFVDMMTPWIDGGQACP